MSQKPKTNDEANKDEGNSTSSIAMILLVIALVVICIAAALAGLQLGSLIF